MGQIFLVIHKETLDTSNHTLISFHPFATVYEMAGKSGKATGKREESSALGKRLREPVAESSTSIEPKRRMIYQNY